MKAKIIRIMLVAALVALAVGGCKKAPRVLTVYYSHAGATGIVANVIHEAVGGDIFVIEPTVAYPAEGTHAVVRQQLDEGTLPTLKGKVQDLASYDVVFVGSPNWFGTMALPVKVWLQENNLAGKKVVPFATYGGGVGETLADIAKMAPQATILAGFSVSGDEAKAGGEVLKTRVDEWLKTITPAFAQK